MFKPLLPKSKRVYIIETRNGSGVTRRISDHLPHVDWYGSSSQYDSELDFNDGVGKSNLSRGAFERFVNSDRYMKLRFKRLLEQARARKEVAT